MSLALPVIPDDNASEQLADALRAVTRGQVRFGRHDRALYSTDASLYQVEPLGVVVPADVEDAAAVVRFCRDNHVPVLPRGGGTSLAGQCTNRAVVIDLSPACRKVLSVDEAARTARVEPGVALDELNRELLRRSHSLRGQSLSFMPDPATAAQATVGGCIGNNAAGARSIRYGRTSENMLGVDLILSTGERTFLASGAGRTDPVALRLARDVARIVRGHAELIRARFPKTIRRNAGYGLDLILHQLDRGVAEEDLDLSGLICGSEGTLGLIVGATLKLHPIPAVKGLAIVSFDSLDDAMDSVAPIISTTPSAVELLDDIVLEAAGQNPVYRAYVEMLPKVECGTPKAVLYVEYESTDGAHLERAFQRLTAALATARIELYRDASDMARAWALRKAGEPLLHALPGDRKPITFVEDNAVPVENLPRFVREFRKIMEEHGTTAAYYAHASVGVLHVRPLIDIHDEADRGRLRSIAVAVADLARECGGVMSGEHGDGRVRGPLLERFFGSELMNAFREVKAVFDPIGLMNPGMITQPGPIESITESLRIDRTDGRAISEALGAVDTYYDYEDQHDFRGAVEMCNGAGVCRKTAGGTMCPSYRATLDERHSTRGRGNALRSAILNNDTGGPAWNDPETFKTLDLCLSCKACSTECPSNVDISRLKAEYTAQSYQRRGTPLSARLFGHVRTLNRMGSILPGVSNWISGLPIMRKVLGKLIGFSGNRRVPEFGTSLFRWFAKRKIVTAETDRPRVVFYADCFATYNDPHIGRAAIELLERLGYEVLLPKVGCCGRAMMSTGLLGDAIRSIDRTLAVLDEFIDDERVVGVVVCEPSCLSAIKDDWLKLKVAAPIERRQKLAAKSMLPEEFVDAFWDRHPSAPDLEAVRAKVQSPVILHGHCHQKALWGDGTSAALLHRLVGDRLTVLPSGCCGMAGSFGYLERRYDMSMKIGELSLFPPLRAAPRDAIVVAPGTSCRHQIHDGTGRTALHPIEFAARIL